MSNLITKEAAVNILNKTLNNGLTGCEMVSIRAIIEEPKLNATGRVTGKLLPIPKNNIREEIETVVGFGYNYGKSVENRLLKENAAEIKSGAITKDEVLSKFKKGKSWHKPVEGNKAVVQHNTTGELYFYYQLNANNNARVKFFDVTTGIEIDKNILEEFLPVKEDPKNQGTKKPIYPRTLKLTNLKALSADGISYEIVN